jgi:hypothetical protein
MNGFGWLTINDYGLLIPVLHKIKVAQNPRQLILIPIINSVDPNLTLANLIFPNSSQDDLPSLIQ